MHSFTVALALGGGMDWVTHDPSARVSLLRHRDEEARKVMDSARAWRMQNKVPRERSAPS